MKLCKVCRVKTSSSLLQFIMSFVITCAERLFGCFAKFSKQNSEVHLNSLRRKNNGKTMKRRNIDNAKFRRSLKKSRLSADGFCGGSLMYLKILLVWAFVMMADFLLDFRFEYFWPTWLLLRSVYDSVRYQGAAFSAFFVCITVTSDLVCFVFIPVQWLFFLASTYVWVQYVWHTDRGVCLPTVSLWLLYVYVEVSIRLKELKSIPFTLDLCRPFAAHCIGYPVVTLGFGVKSYVSYRLRLRKQREVARGNEFYGQLLQEALPAERRLDVDVQKHEYLANPNSEDVISNGAVCGGGNAVAVCHNNNNHNKPTSSSIYSTLLTSSYQTAQRQTKNYNAAGSSSIPKNYRKTNVVGAWTTDENDVLSENGHMPTNTYDDEDYRRYGASTSYLSMVVGWFNEFALKLFGINSLPVNTRALDMWGPSSSDAATTATVDYCRDSDEESGESKDSVDSSNTNTMADGRSLTTKKNFNSAAKFRGGKGRRKNMYSSSAGGVRNENMFDGGASSATDPTTFLTSAKDLNNVGQTTEQKEKVQDKDLYLSLECDMEKLKLELRSSRTREQELRRQLNDLMTSDKSSKNELQQCRQQNEQLQTKLQNLVRARQQDKQTIGTLEKRVCEEQKLKTQLEQQIHMEKKLQKKLEESTKTTASTNPTKLDCTEPCKQRRRELEIQLQQVRRDLQQRDEHLSQIENELVVLRQYKDKNQTHSLMSALTAMQDKNRHLETSLSAETRIKLDLFSALGDAKRQVEIAQNELARKDQELNLMRRRLNEIMNGTNRPMGVVQMPSTTLSMVDNSKVEALAAALYTAPPYTNSMGGLMYNDNLVSTDYATMPPPQSYVPVQNNMAGGSTMMVNNENAVRYTPPRTTASY